MAEPTTWHFRFTIRDLLWLTALVAVLVAWWVDRSKLSRELRLELDRFAGFYNYVSRYRNQVDPKEAKEAQEALDAVERMGPKQHP